MDGQGIGVERLYNDLNRRDSFQFSDQQNEILESCGACYAAAREGDHEQIKVLFADASPGIRDLFLFDAVAYGAVHGRRFETLQWFIVNGWMSDSSRMKGCVIGEGATLGYLDVVQWLLDFVEWPCNVERPYFCDTKSLQGALRDAAKNGHLDVVQLLVSKGVAEILDIARDQAVAPRASFRAFCGDRQAGVSPFHYCARHPEPGLQVYWGFVCDAACAGQFDVAKWLHFNNVTRSDAGMFLTEGAARGNLEVVQWSVDHGATCLVLHAPFPHPPSSHPS